MLANLRANIPYFQATNVGPNHALTIAPAPTWIVDPSLLLQIASNCRRVTQNATYHRLPADMRLRLLQLHFGLRPPYVPGQPAVKAPPMIDTSKAATPIQHTPNQHAMTKARPPPLAPTTLGPTPPPTTNPNPTVPWPAQWTPNPPPPAAHQLAPARHTQRIVKETTTTTTTTIIQDDAEGGIDV